MELCDKVCFLHGLLAEALFILTLKYLEYQILAAVSKFQFRTSFK